MGSEQVHPQLRRAEGLVHLGLLVSAVNCRLLKEPKELGVPLPFEPHFDGPGNCAAPPLGNHRAGDTAPAQGRMFWRNAGVGVGAVVWHRGVERPGALVDQQLGKQVLSNLQVLPRFSRQRYRFVCLFDCLFECLIFSLLDCVVGEGKG